VVDFIEEVEEQLRSDRYRSFARRALPWFAAALAATVIGWLAIWGYNSWQERNIDRASVAYDQAITALAQGDVTGAYTTLDPIAKSGPAGYRTLALIGQGDIRLAAGATGEAVGFYDKAAKAAPNAIFGDAARLKAALALLDDAPYPQLQTRLTALIGDKKPFDLQAREALAMAKLLVGKTSAARGDFNALTLTLGVTPSMRARAQAAIALIDSGEAATAAAVVRMAATLPPPTPGTLGGLPGAPGAQDQSAPQDAAQGESGAGAPGSTPSGNAQ
jgi:hypothetical protein